MTTNKNSKKKKQTRPLIVVTNDDGVNATGIRKLAEVAKQYGEVVMLAPMSSKSGMSHAITFNSPLRLQKIHQEKGMSIYKTSGTPSDAVKLAQRFLLKNKKIDLLLSGINHGSNTSVSTIYSGTVAAAMEGCINKIPSVAFSIVDYNGTCDFEAAMQTAHKIIPMVLEKKLPENVCLNVNIPNVSAKEIKGYKVTRQAMNYWEEELQERFDPIGRSYFWLDGSMKEVDKSKDTDCWAIKHNYVSIMPVLVDFTAHQFIDELKKWKVKK